MLPTREESGYVFDESMLDEIDEKDDALFLCNPSNPAGGLISGHLMRKIVKCCEEKGVLLVVDECFLDFVPAGGRHSAVRYAAAGKNVVVLKAFTKIFAMAGLRLGFALFGSGQAADRVFCFGPPWQVSGPAQAAGLAVLNSPEESRAYLKETVRLIARERERMERELKNMGLIPVPGRANYILFRASPDLGRRLAERGFALRVCSDYEGLCPQERSPFQDNSILTEKTGYKREGGGCAAENVSPSVYYRAAVKNPQEKRTASAGNREVYLMAACIMIQGTMSNAGKSLIAAGLCRVFAQDGYRVAPFKSQNMALNSYVTEEGLEMGRAQAVQAEACGIVPSVKMNPVLLKPTTDMGSQVIVNGRVRANMKAADYFRHKKELIPEIMAAYRSLEEEYEIIVLEGAGSPAEINLKEDDIVNMGMAELADAPVLLVGDIDRGGCFRTAGRNGHAA